MATTDARAYDQLLAQASQLTPMDQLRLLEELAALVRQRLASSPLESITALRGLGKEMWRGVDAQEYVDRERASITPALQPDDPSPADHAASAR